MSLYARFLSRPFSTLAAMNYFALINYIIIMSVTPGPNNLMLTTSGVNFGLKRTLPMCFGVSIGSSIQCLIALSTFHALFSWIEELRFPLAVIGCSYLLWLSWALYQSTHDYKKSHLHAPLGFWQMALFQWVNPKAWLMAINIAILFSSSTASWGHYISIAILNGLVNFPCIFIWAALGSRLKRFLQNPKQLQVFNLTMALLMGGTALWLLADEALFFLATHPIIAAQWF